jgi:hypothetical protein
MLLLMRFLVVVPSKKKDSLTDLATPAIPSESKKEGIHGGWEEGGMG